MSTLDVALLKAKLDKFNRVGGQSSPDALWRPTEGKSVIRIVPFIDDKTNPFIELKFHYLGTLKPILSPTTYGRKDPIAEFGTQLLGKGSKEEYAEAKPFLPNLRTYVPVIVRGEEDKGVRYFSFGKTVYKQLLEFIADPDIGDIASIESGRDLTVTYVPKEKSDTNFAKTTVMYKPNLTPLSTDKALMKKWLTEQPDLKQLFKEHTYSELKVILDNYLDPDAATRGSDSTEDEPVSVTQEVASPNLKTGSSAEMSEFDRLFEEG